MELQRASISPVCPQKVFGKNRLPSSQPRQWSTMDKLKSKDESKRQPGSGNTSLQAATATLQPVHRPTAIPHLEGKLRFIGLGVRAATVLSRLIQNESLEPEYFWYIDSEDKGAGLASLPNRVVLQKEQGNELTGAELRKLIGSGAYDQQGKGNINAGDGGIAFIIASAESVSSSANMLLSLVHSLRAAGFFTAVVLSSPFHFEGARRVQMAAQLIQAVRDAAHLVSVVQQETLIGLRTNDSGASPVTVDDAVNISNNAMEQTVRCILAAVQAPEFLDSSKGALIWHGSEMRRFKRLLSPPLQQLLTRPNIATLGRGAASMNSELAASMGSCQALMHLATDAVQAAIESPFLEDLAGQATGALCCVSLPPGLHGALAGGDSSGIDHASARLAVQAAAGALMQMSSCKEVVMLYTTLQQDDRADLHRSSKQSGFGLEVSLLMLTPREQRQAPADHTRNDKEVTAHRKLSDKGTQTRPGSPKSQSKYQKGVLQTDKAPARGRLPPSNWRLMSAMAGGSTSARNKSPLKKDEETKDKKSRQGVITVSSEPVEQELPSIGDQLAETFIAQSLDLPPKAAKWRQEQRARQERPRLMVQAPEAAWQSQEEDDEDGLPTKLRTLLGGNPQAFDVRERTYAILERDRGDAWESEGFP